MGWLLAIVAGGLLTFNAVVTPDKAASEAKKALQKQFPNAQVQVKIEGKRGKDVLNGRFRKIDIELANLTLTELPLAMSAPAPNAVAQNSPTQNAPATNPSTQNSSVVVRESGGATPATPRGASAPPLRAVEIKTPKAEKIKVGRTGELNITVRDFKWQTLAVERADFRFADVEYDFGALKNRSQFKLLRVGKSTMHLELAPDALTPFVAKRVENVTNANVKINGSQMSIRGARNYYGVVAPFEVTGTPNFTGSEIILNAPKLLVSGVTVPALAAAPILKNVNPLYSFDKMGGLPFQVTLTKVEARDGKLQIDGDLTLK